MNECIHFFNITFFILIILLDVSSIVLYVIILKKDFSTSNPFSNSRIYELIFIICNIISILIVLIPGLHALIFEITDRLVIYVILSGCCLAMVVISGVCYIIFKFINEFLELPCLIISGGKIPLHILSIIFILIERSKIINSIKQSPLNLIDEQITESLYNKIINQSKNPNDEDLKKNIQQRQHEISVNLIN